jgi:hypothetical protein
MFDKGHKGYWLGKKKPHTKETKEKIRKSLLGHKLSEETIEKIREKSSFTKGFTPWNKGKNWSEDIKKKISKTNKIKGIKPKIRFCARGSEHPCWAGGLSPEKIKQRKSIESTEWKRKIFTRDNYTCQKYMIKGGRICAHHICNFADCPELRFDIDNGITLSEKAHREFHKRYGNKNTNREQLEEFLGSVLL